MEQAINNEKNIFYPSGGLLIWIIIFLECITFGMGLIAMITYGQDNHLLYHDSSQTLNKYTAITNTIVLLSSGFFMAETLRNIKLKKYTTAKLFLQLTILFGCIFLGIKSFDYIEKISSGMSISYNIFFTFFWLLTFFHFLHVLLGVIILVYFLWKFNSVISEVSMTENLEAGAAFWHLCDLIWLLLFPVIYLIY
mgnify:FL=1